MKNIIKKHSRLLILFLLFLFLPGIAYFFPSNFRNYILLIGFNIIMYAALGSAWNIIGGLARQVSWAHASFFSIGAYTTMVLLLRIQLSPWLSMIMGALISAVMSFIMGIASFRLQGVYFSLATIAFGQIVYRLLLYFKDFTNGASGLVLPKIKESNFLMMQFTNNNIYYFIMFIMLILVVSLFLIIEESRLGYYLKAIREDEIAAESLGIKPYKCKLIAFVVSAMLVSVIGSIFSMRFKFIDPETVASHDLAMRIGITVIIGGIGKTWGPIIGSFITVLLLEFTNYFFGTKFNGGLPQTIYGMILILVVIFLPEGVISLKDKIQIFKERRRKDQDANNIKIK